jgi:hypothetical protein
LVATSFSDSHVNSKEVLNNNLIKIDFNKELFSSLDTSNKFSDDFDDSSESSEILLSIDAKIVTQAALDYFDQEVKLYSLK